MPVPTDASSPPPGPTTQTDVPAPDEAQPSADANKRAKIVELLKDNKKRFLLELEFVELLANPHYLQNLAENNYLSDPRFLNYLKYLQYWRRPEYIKHISYPHCLYFLEMLQNREFRDQLQDRKYVDLLHTQQYNHWRFHKHHRQLERKQQLAEQEMKAQEYLEMPPLE
mmetsp:Transcript_14277/g.34802  ORF Transcript_14277/g.34802 Transcript_14277/m.34802 type:complete len:169 (-) Transcript_14277:207-713(-)